MRSFYAGPVHLRAATHATAEIPITEAALQDLLAKPEPLQLVYR